MVLSKYSGFFSVSSPSSVLGQEVPWLNTGEQKSCLLDRGWKCGHICALPAWVCHLLGTQPLLLVLCIVYDCFPQTVAEFSGDQSLKKGNQPRFIMWLLSGSWLPSGLDCSICKLKCC